MSAKPPDSYSPLPAKGAALDLRSSAELGRWARLGLAVVAIVLLAVLGSAFSLAPDPRGMGTHQQIPGLGPCSIQLLFGFPCPACGMTTSWSLLTKGQILAALQTNAGGAILAAICLAAAPWFLAAAIRGRWPGFAPSPLAVAIGAVGWLVFVLAEWLVRRGPEVFG